MDRVMRVGLYVVFVFLYGFSRFSGVFLWFGFSLLEGFFSSALLYRFLRLCFLYFAGFSPGFA